MDYQGGYGMGRHLEVVYLTVEVEGNGGLGARLYDSVWEPLVPAALMTSLLPHVIVSQGGGGVGVMTYFGAKQASGGHRWELPGN